MRAFTAFVLFLITATVRAGDVAVEEVRGPVTARLVCDRSSLPLSGEAFVTLSVTGPRRVEVVAAPLLLTEDSLQAWYVTPDDLPLVEEIDGGRQVWSRRFRLRPYLLGPRVPIVTAAITIRAGTLKEFEIAWSKPLEVAVTKTADKEDATPETDAGKLIAEADVNKLKPATGYEELPKGGGPPKNPREQWGVAALVAVVGVVALVVVYLVVRLTRPLAHPELHDADWALRELAALKGRDAPSSEVLARVAYVLREWIELYRRIPATRLTTPELLATLTGAGEDASQAREVGALLDRCDLEKFTPAGTAADIGPVIDRAERLITSGTIIA